MDQNYDFNKKIKEEVDKNQKNYIPSEEGEEGEEQTVQKQYSVSNVEELLETLDNVEDEDIVILLKGEYNLESDIALPNCSLQGENKATTIVKSHGFVFQSTSNSSIEISNITFDGLDVLEGSHGAIHLGTQADIHIHDCDFKNITGEWNSPSIRISKSSPSYSIEINNCLFEGPNTVRKYGHTNSSIAGYHLGVYYNIKIHNNIFNHPTGGYSPAINAKAISFASYSQRGKLENCIAYCNQYLGEADTNFGIEESECTEQQQNSSPSQTPNTSNNNKYDVILTESDYNRVLADNDSGLNRYYTQYPREDSIDSEGNPIHDPDTEVAGHSWESAISQPTDPAQTSSFPWIVLTLDDFIGTVEFKYDGEVKLTKTWNIAKRYSILSIPNDLGMTDYRLVWGTGATGEKTFNPELLNVKFTPAE